MPSIPEQKKVKVIPYLRALWRHEYKTFSRLFLQNAWKLLNFIQIIDPEKMCPSVEQNEIDIYRVSIKDGKYTWKWTCSMHGLYVFWKENHPNFYAFSMKLTFLQFYVNFITKQFLDQTKYILCFLMYQLLECHG
jgi:hypothetical protein